MNKPLLYFLAFLIPAVLFALYKFNPTVYSFFPKCPFHYLTGFDCPGCGSQRAAHALLHGEILKAADFNLLIVLSIPFLAFQFGLQLAGKVMHKAVSFNPANHPLTPKILWVLVIVFWVVRNIPLEPFLYLKA